MNIAIGADHRGYELKEFIKQSSIVFGEKITWIDVGCHSAQRTDYPLYARAVVHEIVSGNAQCGVLLCATGIGMAVAANRTPGIYAGVAWNEETAHLAKEDDNLTILVLPADYITSEQAVRMIEIWLNTTFQEGRYRERIAMIDEL